MCARLNSYVSEAEQTWIYVSDRAGIIATVNFPLLWVFAARNDVFMWLTGWSFATFNVFHKWLARIITVQAILHSVGYTVHAYLGGPRVHALGHVPFFMCRKTNLSICPLLHTSALGQVCLSSIPFLLLCLIVFSYP
jgi:hypothetical protein